MKVGSVHSRPQCASVAHTHSPVAGVKQNWSVHEITYTTSNSPGGTLYFSRWRWVDCFVNFNLPIIRLNKQIQFSRFCPPHFNPCYYRSSFPQKETHKFQQFRDQIGWEIHSKVPSRIYISVSVNQRYLPSGVFIHCGAIICATETLTYGSVLVSNRENVGNLHLDSLEKRKQYNKKLMNMYEVQIYRILAGIPSSNETIWTPMGRSPRGKTP